MAIQASNKSSGSVPHLGLCSDGAVGGLVFSLGYPSSVFSAGGGRSSVEAWFTAELDIEEVRSDVHLFVADVSKSFDTVDLGILDKVVEKSGASWLVQACLL